MLYRKGVERVAEIQSHSIECAVQQNKEMIQLCKQATEKLSWTPRMNMYDDAASAMERFAEAQKAAISLCVDQTRAFVELMKDRATAASKSADTISKFTQQSFERSVSAQKKVAEATVSGTKSAMENVREGFAVPGSEAMAESIQHSVDTVINAQKEVLETARSRRTPVVEKVGAL